MTAEKALAEIERRIRDGIYPADSRLPTTLAFAEEFELSAATIKILMGRLVERGLVRGKQGDGRFVNDRQAWLRP